MNSGSNKHRVYWSAWAALSLVGGILLAWVLFEGDDKTLFMPGPLSDGHHQLAGSCESCHADSFGGGEVLQETCLECHGDVRIKPFDSHPRAKFSDPRNADRLEKINALACITCHTEHKPEITPRDGLTQPRDLCFHCHAEIGKDRPSHQGMAFDTCASAGCHNYHNNRALYTDFLLKHAEAPDTKERARLPGREFAGVLDEILEYPRDHYPVTALQREDADAPAEHLADTTHLEDWLASGHARSGVNCSACHQPRDEQGEPRPWRDQPGPEGCSSCHGLEIKRFGEGKHGMRLAAELSPMTPAMARLPMHEQAAHRELTCNSCHGAHRYDSAYAAAEGCLQCHDDKHSQNYKASAHYRLWQDEVSGTGKPNTGVSCASCHMPRIDFDVNDWMSRTLVDHNQSANFSPNSKMIRSACLHCHGLAFSIDALADRQLIEANFQGRPSVHVESINLAIKDQERYLQELQQPGG